MNNDNIIEEKVRTILQEEIADRVIYETHLAEETLRRGLQSAQSRLYTALLEVEQAGYTRAMGEAKEAMPERVCGDIPCFICGTENNPIWFTDNTLWNATMGEDRYKIVCPQCFVVRANKNCSWQLLPNNIISRNAELLGKLYDYAGKIYAENVDNIKSDTSSDASQMTAILNSINDTIQFLEPSLSPTDNNKEV